jgi:nucleoside-diphosphate-sugar epimerase
MKDKNILIAGGGGELGDCLINHLKNSKYKILVLDKKFKNKTKLDKIKYLKFDFLKKKKIINLPKNIDVIFFFVGMIGGKESLEIHNFKKYLDINCETLINFLKILDKKKVGKIIFTSTEHVYGDIILKKNDMTENEPNPKNFYGVSKLLSEKILYNYFKKKLTCIDILRFPRVITLTNENLIVKLKTKVMSNKKIYLDNLNLKFNFIFINDLLSAFENCINQKNSKFRVLNIFNNSKPISLAEIIKVIKKELLINFEIKYLKNKLLKNHNPINLKVSNKFTKELLKWKPEFTNKQIIKKIVNKNEIK